MELWQLAARECIRDTLAQYNWSGDALRLDDLAAAFCPDGELELRGRAPLRGRAAITEFLGGGTFPGGDEARRAARKAASGAAGGPTAGVTATRIVRHLLTNIRFLEMTPERAQVACYFTVLTEIGLDHHGRYRDTFVPVGSGWLIQHRFVSTDWRAPGSTMAPSVD